MPFLRKYILISVRPELVPDKSGFMVRQAFPEPAEGLTTNGIFILRGEYCKYSCVIPAQAGIQVPPPNPLAGRLALCHCFENKAGVLPPTGC